MDQDILNNLLMKVEGCTFATLDAITMPKPGLRCETVGERVIMFTNKRSSGYENMVKRRLVAAGKNPDNFVLGELPWGERVPNSPLITLRGILYLQTILLVPGVCKYYVGNNEVDPKDFGIRPRRTNQGLPPGEEVLVNTYRLENITRIALMGEVVNVSEKPKRAILHLSY